MLNIFISYVHEDSIIATALYNMLKQTFGGDVLTEVFLDTKSIHAGGDISDEIKGALKRADVLLVVSTGALQPSHSWTGFEVGFFEASHPQQPHDDPANIRGKTITICRHKDAPAPTANHKYVSISIQEALVDENEDVLEKLIEIGRDDELVMFLGDIYFTVEGQKLDGRADLRTEFKNQVKKFKKAVYAEFKCRIKEIYKPQKQLIIRYSSKQLDSASEELPPEAQITSVGGALDVFGIREDNAALKEIQAKEIPMLGTRGTGTLSAKALDWQTFRRLIKNNTLASHWASTLSKVVVSVSVNVDNSQVIASHDRDRRYRVVLTTSTTYFSGEVEASVYLVEALKRKDYGREDTSLLLKGLHIVCRFRFVFLEPQSEFFWFNLGRWSPMELPNFARQLIAELDFLHTEARNAQLDKPGTWAAFVSLQELDAMVKIWAPIETAVRTLCTNAINQSGNQDELEKTLADLINQLKLLAEQITPQNAAMLKAMSVKLAELAQT